MQSVASAAGGVGCLAAAYCVGRRSVVALGKDEQLRVQKLTDTEVKNGPAVKILLPFTYRSYEVRKAETLGTVDYVVLKDTMTGEERVEHGPKLLFLGAYETVESRGEGITLSTTEYVLVEDRLSGQKTVKRGPCVWFPGPQEHGSKASAISLTNTEFVRILDKETGERRIQRGPCIWFPSPSEEGSKKAGISLNSTDYVLVENKQTGEKRIDKGPCVWIPAPLEEGTKGTGISLGSTDYLIVEDKQTGEKSMVKGPRLWFPEPYETASSVQEAMAIQDDEYVRLKDLATGKRWVTRGKAVVFLEPTWKIEPTGARSGRESLGIRKAFVLKAYEYVRLIDTVKGTIRMVRGEATVFPGPNEQAVDGDKLVAFDLKVNEYIKLLDQATGEIRVVAGKDQVFLGPHEKALDGGKQKAVEVDDEHAVLVRDKSTGQQRLVTEKQLFMPGPYDSIDEVRSLIKLAEHEAMIIKDRNGQFHYHFGSNKQQGDQPLSFFMPPSSEVVRLCWSRGRRREKRDLFIERFDCRAKYMSFEFNCRTKDNVELVLEGTFFWEVVDLPVMVRTTGDAPGDICNHARSQFIKQVARVTLKEFMDDLNMISNKVYMEDQTFYQSRGVKVHSLEVTGYWCAEASTSEVLQQIIAETTNRMNRLSQQESQNEVKIFQMQGQIEQEKLNGELLAIQHKHAQEAAEVEGAAEADRVAAFVRGLEKDVPKLEDRVMMWQTLRKTDALGVVSQGGASLYFTPSDVDLSIEGSAKRAE